MFVSVALAFLAASATPAQASSAETATPAAPAVKPRKICRSEAVIGSLSPKRVCTIVQPRTAAPAQSRQSVDQGQQPQAQQSAGSGN